MCNASGCAIVLDDTAISRIYVFIIYKVMKYNEIVIKYNAYFKNAIFHSRENIRDCISLHSDGWNWMSSAFFNDFL